MTAGEFDNLALFIATRTERLFGEVASFSAAAGSIVDYLLIVLFIWPRKYFLVGPSVLEVVVVMMLFA